MFRRIAIVSVSAAIGVSLGSWVRRATGHNDQGVHLGGSGASGAPCEPQATPRRVQPLHDPTSQETDEVVDTGFGNDSGAMAEWNAIWERGAHLPWKERDLDDPDWGPRALERALGRWRSMLGDGVALACDEYPCIVLVPTPPASGHANWEVEVIRALESTGHWPTAHQFGAVHPAVIGIGMVGAPMNTLDVEILRVRVEHRIDIASRRLETGARLGP